MSASSWSADRTTHVKIVAVSVVAAVAVGLVGVSARVADPASGTARTLLPREEATPLVVAVHIPDPPAIPCRQQAWPNVDRHCLSWTSPQSGPPVVARGATGNPATRTPEAASESQSARRLALANDGQPSVSRVRKVQRRTIESARVAHRGNDDLSDVPVRGFAGETRHDVVRPTNAQDVYYYSARPLSTPQASTPFSSLPVTGR